MCLAGEPGFEPVPTESESAVLPLYYSPKSILINDLAGQQILLYCFSPFVVLLISSFVPVYQSHALFSEAFFVHCGNVGFYLFRCFMSSNRLYRSGICFSVCQLRCYCVTQAMKCKSFSNRFKNSDIHLQSAMSPTDDFARFLHV